MALEDVAALNYDPRLPQRTEICRNKNSHKIMIFFHFWGGNQFFKSKIEDGDQWQVCQKLVVPEQPLGEMENIWRDSMVEK